MDSVRETCGSSKPCSGYKEKLERCNDRVNGKSQTEETCVEELFDFLHCADSCVSILSVDTIYFCLISSRRSNVNNIFIEYH